MTILYLTFYFDPDLGPGSFRNTSLVNELSSQLSHNDSIHVITTQPNRYQSYQPTAAAQEEWTHGGCPILIQRIAVPRHKSGLLDQAVSFWVYFRAARQLTRGRSYELVFASSSRLFTAFLGAQLARRHKTGLFLDIRDLFREAILEKISWPIISSLLRISLRVIERYTFGYASHINLVSKGFASYFEPFQQATYSYYTNGIDPLFLNLPVSQANDKQPYKTILYAGNVGEGQGLHTIIPQAASLVGHAYRFRIIGDGGAMKQLKNALAAHQITTVELSKPLARQALISVYQRADYLLVHLTDWAACQRVLPSKLFEYGATDKPILAGVAGFAAAFIQEHVPNAFVFKPGDADSLSRILREVPYHTQPRQVFKRRFSRHTINRQLVQQIRRVLDESVQHKCTVTNAIRP